MPDSHQTGKLTEHIEKKPCISAFLLQRVLVLAMSITRVYGSLIRENPSEAVYHIVQERYVIADIHCTTSIYRFLFLVVYKHGILDTKIIFVWYEMYRQVFRWNDRDRESDRDDCCDLLLALVQGSFVG